MEQLFNTVNVNSGVFILITAWSLFWKGMSTWRAARNNQLYWFVALLLINTIGILDIVYIRFFQKEVSDKREWPWGINRFFKR